MSRASRPRDEIVPPVPMNATLGNPVPDPTAMPYLPILSDAVMPRRAAAVDPGRAQAGDAPGGRPAERAPAPRPGPSPGRAAASAAEVDQKRRDGAAVGGAARPVAGADRLAALELLDEGG